MEICENSTKMLKPEANQMDEIKMQKLNDSESDNFDENHSVLSNNSNISQKTSTTITTSPAANNNHNNIRRLRHQNFSKNIYIGTKNAERWDLVRSGLKFKNDVEFVSFLLRMAESGHGTTFLEETK
jgi:hypothetical protein